MMKTINNAVNFFSQPDRAHLRGYSEANRIIHERIAQTNGFQLGRYLGENISEPVPNDLLQLLGTYLDSSTDAEYRNGDPNSLNMILWYIALYGFAGDIAKYIRPNLPSPQTGQLSLHPFFQSVLDPFKTWPELGDQRDKILLNYWMAVMKYDAPEQEFEIWKTFALQNLSSEKSAERALHIMTFAILYNPYFLLGD